MPRTAPRVPPPVVALTALAVQSLLTRGAEPRPLPGRRTLAISLAVAATAAPTAAFRQFLAADTTPDPMRPGDASTLVTEGVFARTRNPMYLGLGGLLAANAVRTGRFRSLLPLAGFVAWIDRLQVPAEEAALAERFGASYEDYRSAVRRWL